MTAEGNSLKTVLKIWKDLSQHDNDYVSISVNDIWELETKVVVED